MSRPIYLDHHATTPLDPRVLRQMMPYFENEFGNAASKSHEYGWAADSAVEFAREKVARCLGAHPKEILFTSGATESNALALEGVMYAHRSRGNHLVVGASEHASVLEKAKQLESRGFSLSVVPCDSEGKISADQVELALRPETVMVSVMMANNEVGTVNPIQKIGSLCREKGIFFHSDAAQAWGRIPVSVEQLPVDLLSLSAHKIHGPKGVGALYIRRRSPRVTLEPLFVGGGHEQGLRAGTQNVPAIVGMGAAIELALKELSEESSRLARLRDRLWTALQAQIPDLVVNGSLKERLPHNLHVSVPGVDGGVLITEMRKVALSSGAACASYRAEPSHVLKAMQVPEALARASLRMSLGRFTTEAEVDQAAVEIAAVIQEIRRR